MKRIISLLLIIVTFLGSCTKEDMDDIRKRLSLLEEWQSSVNDEISAMKSIIQALENRDYVNNVSQLADGSGYVIHFVNAGAITIKNGTNGETPIIGARIDSDGKYYWTINGEYLISNGIKLPVTGNDGTNGLTPHIGDNGNWWLGASDTGIKAAGENGNDGVTPHIGDNGNWWIGSYDTGVKATGDNGITPHIGNNGNWWIATSDTGVKATGENGVTPHIGSDGYWWIGNQNTGIKAQGENGKDAIAPQLRINTTTNLWEISIDGGNTWTSMGVHATGEKGDSLFQSVDDTDSDFVILTLADGNTFKLPRYKNFKIGTDNVNTAIEINKVSAIVLPLKFPDNFTANDYTAIMGEIKSSRGSSIDIATRSTSQWLINITAPTFDANGSYNNDASVSIQVPSDIQDGETAILEVTVIDNIGGRIVAARALRFVSSIISYDDLGTGTQSDPYRLINAKQIYNLAEAVNNGDDMENIYFILSNDISLIDYPNWIPIGSLNSPFKGLFNGNDKTVSDMTINFDVDNDSYTAGLFGCIDTGCQINDLAVNGNITLNAHQSGDKYIGATIGYIKDGSIKNLSADVKIHFECNDTTSDAIYIGGLIGKSEKLTTYANFSSTSLQVIIPTIIGDSYFYLGHHIGWSINNTWTRNANQPYTQTDSSFDLTFEASYNKSLCLINGYALSD